MKKTEKTEKQESLSGSIERVTFHSEATGFCVLRLKAKEQLDLMTVVGYLAAANPGEFVDCVGSWVNTVDYGLQFKAEHIHVIMPSTLEGMEKYLGSGLIRGIGPHFAKRLMETFGDKVFDVIENEPDRLLELAGIGENRRDQVLESWKDQKIIREIMIFLQSHGIGTARAVRIYKTYGQQSIALVQKDPYRLALDIRGIGFKTADRLAERLGVPKDSMLRVQAGIRHSLQAYTNEGHCAMEQSVLIDSTAELLELSAELVQQAIELEAREDRIVIENADGQTLIFLMGFYRAEQGVVRHLRRLSTQRATWIHEIVLSEAIARVQDHNHLVLSDTQKDALRLALRNKITIITGGPGVGKTTLVKSILDSVQIKTQKILLAAPTGRAAKRLSDSTGVEAKTLHRLLEFDPQTTGFKRHENNPLEADLIVIDELSMVDITMMYALLRAVPDESVLILVGDVDQLPSVGPGAVLSDLITSETIPTVYLTEIFRQAKESKIVLNAHRVNQGQLPQWSTDPARLSDFYFIPVDTPEHIYETLLRLLSDRIPKRFGLDPIRDIQVLSPMNRGGLGAKTLNIALQKHLNPMAPHAVTRFGCTYAEGDKVIQTVNNYQKEVFNGDIGFITSINLEEGVLSVLFEGRLLRYELNDLDELSLAYATTIHKSQGSEYPAVIIPIAMQHYKLLQRNLLYTGMTRGKSLVVLVGQLKALAMAVRTMTSHQRVTQLSARLRALVV